MPGGRKSKKKGRKGGKSKRRQQVAAQPGPSVRAMCTHTQSHTCTLLADIVVLLQLLSWISLGSDDDSTSASIKGQPALGSLRERVFQNLPPADKVSAASSRTQPATHKTNHTTCCSFASVARSWQRQKQNCPSD